MWSRRGFLKIAGLAGGLGSFAHHPLFSAIHSDHKHHPICYFTKHLKWLSFEELGSALKEAGFDGADLTVRSNGHIEPGKALTELPKAVSALNSYGITVPMVVTKVVDAEADGTDDLLQVLADNGVQYYRMGYLDYNRTLTIEQNLKLFRDIFQRLAEKNSKYGICGVYQNHAGTRLGASIWDLKDVLQGIDPDVLGCQFDIRHAVYEGGRSWENDMWAIRDHIRTTVVKDFYWAKNEDGNWKNKNTLMGEGMVDFETYFRLYHEMKIEGPISNHSEYQLIKPEEKDLPKNKKIEIAISRLRQDVELTKEFLK